MGREGRQVADKTIIISAGTISVVFHNMFCYLMHASLPSYVPTYIVLPPDAK